MEQYKQYKQPIKIVCGTITAIFFMALTLFGLVSLNFYVLSNSYDLATGCPLFNGTEESTNCTEKLTCYRGQFIGCSLESIRLAIYLIVAPSLVVYCITINFDKVKVKIIIGMVTVCLIYGAYYGIYRIDQLVHQDNSTWCHDHLFTRCVENSFFILVTYMIIGLSIIGTIVLGIREWWFNCRTEVVGVNVDSETSLV